MGVYKSFLFIKHSYCTVSGHLTDAASTNTNRGIFIKGHTHSFMK